MTIKPPLNNRATVRRFQNLVALAFDGEPTLYLTPAQAFQLAHTVQACVADIRDVPLFQEKKFNSVTVENGKTQQ